MRGGLRLRRRDGQNRRGRAGGCVRRARPRDGRVGRRETDDYSPRRNGGYRSPPSRRCSSCLAATIPTSCDFAPRTTTSAPAMYTWSSTRHGQDPRRVPHRASQGAEGWTPSRGHPHRENIHPPAARRRGGALHSRDIVYRDLKPANAVVTGTPPLESVLVDFGEAARLRRSERLNELPPLGTSLFQAPEVEERAEYGQQSDMCGPWAC